MYLMLSCCTNQRNVELLLWFLCLVKKKKSGGEIKHLIGDLFMLGLHESGYCARFKMESWKDVMHIRLLSTVNLWNWYKEVCSQALESPWLKTESNPDKKKENAMHRYSHVSHLKNGFSFNSHWMQNAFFVQIMTIWSLRRTITSRTPHAHFFFPL